MRELKSMLVIFFYTNSWSVCGRWSDSGDCGGIQSLFHVTINFNAISNLIRKEHGFYYGNQIIPFLYSWIYNYKNKRMQTMRSAGARKSDRRSHAGKWIHGVVSCLKNLLKHLNVIKIFESFWYAINWIKL